MTNRRRFLKFGALGGLLGAAACAIQSDGRRNPYYSGPVSDHFDGVRFFNPDGTPLNGVGDLLRWRFGTEQAEWPDAVPWPPCDRSPAWTTCASRWWATRRC